MLPILSTDEIIEARNVVREVYLDEKIEQYIADIVFATRYPEQYGLKDLKNYIEFGGSPRASINLALAARAYAFIKRRGYVIPEDVRAIAMMFCATVSGFHTRRKPIMSAAKKSSVRY